MADDRIAVLEERLNTLERVVAELRATSPHPAAVKPNDPFKDHPMFRQSITDPKELAEFETRINKLLGIDHLKPVGVQKVREMMIADGVDPNDNEFSRGIIEMREE